MALKMKDLLDPQPESGQGSHTQESGDECLSANLVYYNCEYCEEILTNSDQPKQHSSVRPILNEKLKELELSPMDEKVPLSVDFGPEPQKVSSEEDMASLDPMMPQNPTYSNMVQEEGSVEPSPETSVFVTVEKEIIREDNCLNMDGEHPAEGELVEQQKGRMGDKSKKRKRTGRSLMANKKRLLGLGLIAAIVVISITAVSVAGEQPQNSGSNNNGSINSGAPKPNSAPDINGPTSSFRENQPPGNEATSFDTVLLIVAGVLMINNVYCLCTFYYWVCGGQH